MERSFKEIEERGGEYLEEIQNLYKRRAKRKNFSDSERESGIISFPIEFPITSGKVKELIIDKIPSMLNSDANISDML